jgi:hypothetical protein
MYMMKRAILVSSFLLFGACGGDGPTQAGGSCDPAAAGACADGLVCQPGADGNNICQVALGGTCDLAAPDAYCVEGTACVEVTEVVDGVETTAGGCYFPEGSACDPALAVQCDPALDCAQHVDSTYLCRVPLLFRGRVFDSISEAGIEGAHIIGLDDKPIAVTDIAISGLEGAYDLRVPVLRQADGTPISTNFTLRASADGYDTFPGGIRTALPISTTLAAETEEAYLVTGTLTDLALIPVVDAGPRSSISGQVTAPGQEAGVLVVANGVEAGYSAISDASGAFTIFNVPAGEYEVRGYALGLQLTAATVTVDGADITDVELALRDSPLNTISGTMQIVDPAACLRTSVVLAVESTFDELLGRGELPPGLRSPAVGEPPSIANGETWTIEGIPDGRYVVLAGFENDACVRDPDTSIAGTQIVRIDLPADAGALAETFKVTGAMAMIGPGAEEPEAVTAAPTLEWADDASEASYLVEVFDAYGNLVWDKTLPQVNGPPTVTVLYEGLLDPGMYYQFRATSINQLGAPLSRTEDLRGVFYVP